jgi:hypothetical protein
MNSDIYYEISGEDQNCLQIVLKRNEALIVDSASMCWFSESLDIENMDSMWSVLIGWRTDLLCVKNKGMDPVMLGLAVPLSGRVLALNFDGSSTRGLFCFKDSFIAANSGTAIEARPFPQPSKCMMFLCCAFFLIISGRLNSSDLLQRLCCLEQTSVHALLHTHREITDISPVWRRDNV